MVRLTRPAYVLLIALVLSGRMRLAQAQEPGRIKIAEESTGLLLKGTSVWAHRYRHLPLP